MRSIALMRCFLIFSMATVIEGWFHHEENCQNTRPLTSVIDAVMEGMIQRHSCILIIVDAYHHRTLNFNWTTKSSLVSVYMVVMEEDEGSIFPSEQLNQTLSASKTTDCNAYVILNKNTSRVGDLLLYGEKEGSIDTRGDFLLLQDDQLFNSMLYDIWNRIVNVLFIRSYNSDEQCSTGRRSSQWFDLNTMPFPLPIDEVFELWYIDTWYRDRFQLKNVHFPDKTKDLGQQSLRVTMFEHIPTISNSAISYYNENRLDESKPFGIEFEIIRIIAEVMNFRIDFYASPNFKTEKWGTIDENGSYSGLFGDAITNNTAFVLGDLYYTSQHLTLLDLSVPYNTECLTFLTPESLHDNSWKILIMPFKLYMWICIIVTLITSGLIFHGVARFYVNVISSWVRDTTNRIDRDDSKVAPPVKNLHIFAQFQNSILYTYGTLVGVSLPYIPYAWSLRVFIGWWWIYCILVTVAYRASMTAILSNPISRITIDTLNHLVKSEMIVGSWNEEVRGLLLSSLDGDSRKIGQKFEIVADEEEAIARVGKGEFAFWENEFYLRHARAKRRIDEKAYNENATKHENPLSADRNLHIMSECVINMPISVGLNKNSPLKKRVDVVIRRVVEAGLVQKWLSDTMQWAINAEKREEITTSKSLINLHKFYGALVALGIGYILSCVAYVCEAMYWKYVVQRHPMYDKYYMDRFYSQFE